MLQTYLYIFLEMLLILVIIRSFYIAGRNAPNKIKVLAIAALSFSLLRITSNILLFASENIMFLYVLRFANMLSIVLIPIIGLLSVYIFYRSESIKFDYVIVIGSLIILGYILSIFKLDYYIKRTEQFGYVISLKQWVYYELILIIMVSALLIICLAAVGRKVANNKGLMLIIIASTVTISEIAIKILGVQQLPNLTISDGIWIVTIHYALSTMKLSKGR